MSSVRLGQKEALAPLGVLISLWAIIAALTLVVLLGAFFGHPILSWIGRSLVDLVPPDLALAPNYTT